MVNRIKPADKATRAYLLELHERDLPLEEYLKLSAIPIDHDEREQLLELVAWFTRRYPTAEDRLAYARRAYRRWTAGNE